MKEINRQKWQRMKLIIEKFKEKGNMTLAEIEQLICKSEGDVIGKRTVQNYLAELVALGLIHNNSPGLYRWTENKRVFKSKHDYAIALKHSRALFEEMTPDIEGQPFSNPENVFDLLVFKPAKYAYLINHLKTGYSDDFWTPFQAYYGLMAKYDFPIVVSGLQRKIGKLSFELLEHDLDIPRNLTQAVFYKDNVFIPDENERRGWFLRNLDAKLLNDKMQRDFMELIRLKTKLVKETLFIMSQVQHGIPLLGFCGCCPDRNLTIKDAT